MAALVATHTAWDATTHPHRTQLGDTPTTRNDILVDLFQLGRPRGSSAFCRCGHGGAW